MSSVRSEWAKRVVCCVLVVAAAGCGERGDQLASPDENSERAIGRVLLPLVTRERQGYRLRAARFDIKRTGSRVVTLDSDADLTAVALEAELPQGSYQVSLQDGWALERAGDGGALIAVSAALLTPNPQSFDVQNARVTELIYSFATDNGTVTLGRGAVSVNIDVGRAPTSGCSPINGASCPAGETCLLEGSSGRTFCAQAGTLEVGEPCTSDQCVTGAQCLALDPNQPEARTCERFCSPASSFCGCQGLAGYPDVGVCTEAVTGVAFSHDFAPNQDSQLACSEWSRFQNDLRNVPGTAFTRVILGGSRDGSFECSDPAAAQQICDSIRHGYYTRVFCQGHTWAVDDCYSPEVTVDSPSCGCPNAVRACNSQFGGVGAGNCNVRPQTLSVICDTTRIPRCGDGVVDDGEVCDTNGAGPDMPTPPGGQRCKADCKGFEPTPVGIPRPECVECTQLNCQEQLTACFDAADNVWQSPPASCELVLGCMQVGFSDLTSCAMDHSYACYCGSNSPSGSVDLNSCLSGFSTGQCKELIVANSGCVGSPNEPACILNRWNDTEWGYGDANQIVSCQRSSCSFECGLTP